MNQADLIKLFNSIRDVPYSIPLRFGAKDNCCSGKSERLLALLIKNGFKARYRMCVFLWDSLPLPPKVKKIPHDKDCTHVFVEIKLNGKWKTLDAMWDPRLKKVLPVNDWDGKSNTEIGVKPILMFNPQKSDKLMRRQNKKVIDNDLAINGAFYKALNDWFKQIRK